MDPDPKPMGAANDSPFLSLQGIILREAVPSLEPDTLNGPTRGRALQRCERIGRWVWWYQSRL